MSNFYLEMGGIPSNNNKSKTFSRNWEVCINDKDKKEKFISEMRERCNNTDIYFCMYLFDNPKNRKKSNFLGPLCFDLDGEGFNDQSIESVRQDSLKLIAYLMIFYKLREKDIKIYFSGAKGFHIIIPPEVFGINPNNKLNVYYKAVVDNIVSVLNIKSIDKKIYDNRRLLRVNNSINSKTGLYKIRLTLEELRTINYETIKELAKNPRDISKELPGNPNDISNYNYQAAIALRDKIKELFATNNKLNKQISPKKHKFVTPKEKQELLPCVKYVLSQSYGEGNRNNTLVALATSLYNSGWNIEETIEILTEWNEENNPPLPQSELVKSIRSANHMFFEDGKRYGCMTFLELVDNNLCLECKVYKQRLKRQLLLPRV